MRTSYQAEGRLTADYVHHEYPWRVVIMVEGGLNRAGDFVHGWAIYQVFEEATKAEAVAAGVKTMEEVLGEEGVLRAHFYVGLVIGCDHDWETDSTGLIDDCAICGEGRA